MSIYLLLPVVLIVAGLIYSQVVSKRVQNMSPEEIAARFHATYASYFKLKGDEKIVAAWSGVAFLGAEDALEQGVKAAANAASAALTGVSSYVPQVHVVETDRGRLLVAREYSELGQRGNFEQVADFDEARILDAQTARIQPGKPPKNPLNPLVQMEYAQLSSADGQLFEAWLSPQGGRVGQAALVSIHERQAA